MPPRSNQLTVRHAVLQLIPGPLEMEIMEVLWTDGECSVREVVRPLHRPIAYTTVMTTLDRMFKKEVVRRRMHDRAYIYSPRATCEQWRETVVRDVVAKLLVGADNSHELLLACLIKTLLEQQPQLLEKLNRQTSSNGP